MSDKDAATRTVARSTFGDTDSLAMFTEVKPAEPLMALIGSGTHQMNVAALDYVDSIMRRMTIAWDSKPDVLLELVFWQYDVTAPNVPRHAFLYVYSARKSGPWFAYWGDSPAEPVTWPGMGPYARLHGGL
jgi:hypothetical protein